MATIQNNTMYGVRVQYKGANAEAWPSDYVLLAGEVGYELDTTKYKIGDGTKTWAQLDYYSEPTITAAVEALTGRVTSVEGRLDIAEANITSQGNRISALEGITVISGNPAPAA